VINCIRFSCFAFITWQSSLHGASHGPSSIAESLVQFYLLLMLMMMMMMMMVMIFSSGTTRVAEVEV